MNNANDFKAYFERLKDLTGKDMPEGQIRRLSAEFRRIGIQKTEKIISEIERIENTPRNMIAAVLNAIDRMKEADEAKQYSATSWKTQELCTTPDDFELFFRIHAFIMKIHADDKVPRNNNPESLGPDLESWQKMGCGKTWSPIIDSFLIGYQSVYKNEKLCTDYMRRFYKSLVDNFKTGVSKNV